MIRTCNAALAGLAAVVLLGVSHPMHARSEESSAPVAQRFETTAISLGGLHVGGGSARSGSTHVLIDLARTSTDAERESLRAALGKSTRELSNTLSKMEPVGRIRIGGRLGYDLRYARELVETDGQRHLILATDRPIQFWETMRSSPSRDFDVAVIELLVDSDGKGSGTAIPAAQVVLDKTSGDIELINLSTTPVQLVNVRSRR